MKRNRIRSSCCALLTAALVLSAGAAGLSGSAVFAAGTPRDVKGHWAQSYIEKAIGAGIVSGYENGEFRPDNPVTRAEFSHMLNQALGNTGTASVSFSDVNRNDWFYGDITRAVAAGYVSGYSNGTFGPDKSISRQEAAIMLSLVVPVAGYNRSLSGYPDYKSVDSWAKSAMEYIVGKGYITTYSDGALHPQDTMTRAMAATLIAKILDKENIVTKDPDVTKSGTKLSNAIYSNGVTISRNVGDGDASLSGCVVLGTLNVEGGGTSTVTLSDSRVAQAVVQKSSGAVRVLAKGVTSVKSLSAANSATLETSSLSGDETYGAGFQNITVVKNADITLKGSFPSVTADGASCDVRLASGRIDTLTVSSSAREADITVDSGATIALADVAAQSSFHGSGAVTKMHVSANDVTYEKKPGSVTVSSGVTRSPALADETLSVTPDPKKGATGVAVDKKITLTFNSALKLYKGGAIGSSDLKNIIELRRKTESGSSVAFTASINSAKKVITITPDSDLDTDTKYYVVIDKNEFKDEDGDGNDAFSTYFTTGDSYEGYASYTPKNGATNVAVGSNLTVRFSEKMITYDRTTIKNSDISDIITLRKNNSSGTKVAFSGSIDSAKKVITIDPSSNLDPGTKYYLGVNSKSLRTDSNETAVPASSVTFTTASLSNTPSISLTASGGDNSITVSASGSVAGTIHAVLLSSGAGTPTAAQIISGKDSSGNPAISKISAAVSANTAKEIGRFTGLSVNTSYKVCAVLAPSSSAYNNSAVAVKTASTNSGTPASALSDLTVFSGGKNYPVPLKTGDTSYTLTVPFGSEEAVVSASTSGGRTTVNGVLSDGTAQNTVRLSRSETTCTIVSSKSGALDTTYKLTIKVAGNTDLKSVVAGGTILKGSSSYSYEIPADAGDVDVYIESVDPSADLAAGPLHGSGSLPLKITQAGDIPFTVTSNGDSKTYTLKITKAETPPDPGVTDPDVPDPGVPSGGAIDPSMV